MRDRLGMLRSVQVEDCESTGSVVILIESPNCCLNKFFADVTEIRRMNKKIQSYVDEVKEHHRAILCAPQINEKLEKDLESSMANIKSTANLVQNRLKVIDSEIQRMEDDPNSTVGRIQRIQYAMLVREFSDGMFEYNKTQVDYRERCKNRIRRQLKITGRSTTNADIEEMLEHENPSVFTQGIIAATKEEKNSLADIEARHADIIKLESSIKGLHEMFTDMALLVENQGEMIDRIENNVGQAVTCIRKATEDTNKAREFHTAAVQKKFVFGGIATLLLLIFFGLGVSGP